MDISILGKKAFAYTAAHDLDLAKRTIVFVHGAGLDHSWWGLQSRYFGYHGCNVLAVDLPAHGRSDGPALVTIGDMADWLKKILDGEKIKSAAIVGQSLNLARSSAPRAADRFFKLPLFEPLAERCALTWLLSIESSSGMGPVAAIFSKMRCQTRR